MQVTQCAEEKIGGGPVENRHDARNADLLSSEYCMHVMCVMYVCMHVCMYVYMYACMYVCMYVCTYGCMYG